MKKIVIELQSQLKVCNENNLINTKEIMDSIVEQIEIVLILNQRKMYKWTGKYKCFIKKWYIYICETQCN